MPNLVGIGNTQVPTNAMLGGLAYQDSTNATLESVQIKNISQIKSEISRTAKAVFVYDTRKDTDGGAWRHRCSDKSWYQQPLNTDTRGSRREFPAVAILVLLAGENGIDFVIYDADQPHCPMWMVFQFNNGSGTNRDIHACNGIIAYATSANGSPYVDLLLDQITYHNTSHRHETSPIYPSNLPSVKEWATLNHTGYGFPNSSSYEVFCKVMPDAVDYRQRGLLMPDMLFSTAGGLAQVKSNGQVYTHVYSGFVHRFSKFTQHGMIVTAMDNAVSAKWINMYPPLTANRTTDYGNSSTNVYVHYSANDQYRLVIAHTVSPENTALNHMEVSDGDDIFFASNKGMGFATIGANSNYARMVHYVTKDFVSGYQMQLSRLAICCGTQKKYNFNEARIYSSFGTSVRSANYTVEYSDDNTNWSVAFGGVMSNNTATGWQQGTKTTNNNITTKHRYWRYVEGSAVASHHPRVSRIELGEGSPLTTYHTIMQYVTDNTSDSGDYQPGTIKVDTYQLGAMDDRSPLARHCMITNDKNDDGSLTVTPCKLGSDLVGFSGWSNTAFIKQNYHNGSLDFGYGDLSVAFWCKVDISSTGFVFDRANPSSTGNRYAVYFEGGRVKWYFHDGSATEVASPTTGSAANPPGLSDSQDNIWTFIVCTRHSGSSGDSTMHKIYVNGRISYQGNATVRNTTNTGASIIVGHRHNAGQGAGSSNAFDGDIALLRISNDIPNDAQVEKMYEREKTLFQENAKCLLSAEDSDRVFKMAYDTSTGSLHATNETGRDEFRGLRRLNSTGGQGQTSISISASNGLVVAE